MSLTARTICVYCASSADIDRSYVDVAHELGRLIAAHGHRVVCGAGRTGLMGALVDGVNDVGGVAVGVIPRFMVDNRWHHSRLGEMIVTADMHERKETMARLADAVIAMPGGCGTLEELLEIITWRQLGLYAGNIVVLNVNNYYTPLLQMLDKAVEQGFMKSSHSQLWQVAATPQQALEMALGHVELEIQSKY